MGREGECDGTYSIVDVRAYDEALSPARLVRDGNDVTGLFVHA